MKPLIYQTTPTIQKVIDSIGQTEDVKFSPDERFLAVVDFSNSKIQLFEIHIENVDAAQIVNLTNCITIDSNHFKNPHGLDFIGNKHFVVANRAGDVTIYRIPIEFSGHIEIELTPVGIIKAGYFYGKIGSPGSVRCYQVKEDCYRLFVCNNYLHTIVSFEINISGKIQIKNKGVLLKRDLAVPDGIDISQDRKWIAVSNHNTGTVLIYRLSLFLNRFTAPSGTLKNIAFPHGLRFSADGKTIFVADAGSQYLHIYESDNWVGSHKPVRSLKLVKDASFSKGRVNVQEGGIKGIEVTKDKELLVTTAKYEVLNFYSITELMGVPANSSDQYLLRDQLQLAKEYRTH